MSSVWAVLAAAGSGERLFPAAIDARETNYPFDFRMALGQAEVLDLFRASRVGTIAGCQVTDGRVVRGAEARLVRDGTVIWTGRVGSLRRFKDDVNEVTEGLECGLVLEGYQDVKVGDVLEFFETKQIEQTLE